VTADGDRLHQTARIGAIILAAGRSSRMGTPKALLHFDGRPLLEHLTETYRLSRLEPVVVVASGVTYELARSLPGIEVVAGDSERPMISSVAIGLAAIRDRASAVIVQPVDAPFTSAEMLAALIAGNGRVTRILCHAGRPGHPVLVPEGLFSDIAEEPEGGLATVLSRYDVELVEWPDDAVLADIDTPEDAARWRQRHARDLH
jgi:molybdenum cofactor cytidylyltransferase